MITFDRAIAHTSVASDHAPHGFFYLDTQRVRDLALPLMNAEEDGQPKFRDLMDFCDQVRDATGLKMYKILCQPWVYWSRSTIDRIALYLQVMPEDIKRTDKPKVTVKIERAIKRPQDFNHDVFQELANEWAKGKRLTVTEYNDYLGNAIGCSAKTIYNLRNGTANPSNFLVDAMSRYFNRPVHLFYR
jgi:DNA-binding XRE family transcriptional regulator